ncbi:histone-fold-containing protein [Usnea florida]
MPSRQSSTLQSNVYTRSIAFNGPIADSFCLTLFFLGSSSLLRKNSWLTICPGQQDLSLPRTMVQRLAKGVLPANTSLHKDAILAMSKGATVFINYLAHTANSASLSTGKRSIPPNAVIDALAELEFESFGPRVEAELKKFNEVQTGKRNEYRRKGRRRRMKRGGQRRGFGGRKGTRGWRKGMKGGGRAGRAGRAIRARSCRRGIGSTTSLKIRTMMTMTASMRRGRGARREGTIRRIYNCGRGGRKKRMRRRKRRRKAMRMNIRMRGDGLVVWRGRRMGVWMGAGMTRRRRGRRRMKR